MFHVGQKVVCVDADSKSFIHTNDTGMHGLTTGQIYTVREVAIDPIWGCPALWLKEITRPLYDGVEVGFWTRRFRPVVERKTDISIFQAMLNPKHEQVSA